MIRFKVDENLPTEAASVLIAAGYDALTVFDQDLAGQQDPLIADICRKEGRALITLDLDFASIQLYPPADFAGIIVLRLNRLDKHGVLNAISRLTNVLNRESLLGKLWIVDEARVRIRS